MTCLTSIGTEYQQRDAVITTGKSGKAAAIAAPSTCRRSPFILMAPPPPEHVLLRKTVAVTDTDAPASRQSAPPPYR